MWPRSVTKLRERRGRTFNFTNKRFTLIKDFFNLSKDLFDYRKWNTTIRYNKDIDIKIIMDLKNKLINLGLDKNKISIIILMIIR